MSVRVRRTFVAGMEIRTSARPSIVTASLLATKPLLAGAPDEPSNVRLCQPRHASYCSCRRKPRVVNSTDVTGGVSGIEFPDADDPKTWSLPPTVPSRRGLQSGTVAHVDTP